MWLRSGLQFEEEKEELDVPVQKQAYSVRKRVMLCLYEAVISQHQDKKMET